MPETLFHVSENPDIQRFDPRPAPDPGYGLDGLMVWAIDFEHLHNYLFPRDCPRVTFYARPDSHPDDVTRLMGGSAATFILAIESSWLSRFLEQSIYLYELPGETFSLLDAGAGYYISREAVVPRLVRHIDDIAAELFKHNVELRVMPSLWQLRDAVVASSLQFSIIRMRNAQPRPIAV